MSYLVQSELIVHGKDVFTVIMVPEVDGVEAIGSWHCPKQLLINSGYFARGLLVEYFPVGRCLLVDWYLLVLGDRLVGWFFLKDRRLLIDWRFSTVRGLLLKWFRARIVPGNESVDSSPEGRGDVIEKGEDLEVDNHDARGGDHVQGLLAEVPDHAGEEGDERHVSFA
jgi:hypothetical protein